jgi:hypothetical protein
MDNYLDIRNNIRLLYDTKQYIKCISACNSLLESLEHVGNEHEDYRYNKWFVHKRLSIIYCKFKKNDEAMYHAEQSIKIHATLEEYYLTIWLMALIQIETNKRRAIKLLDKCIFYYGRTKQTNYLMSVVKNKNCIIAKSNNNIKQLQLNDDIKTFNNTANIIEYIFNNAYNIALEIIDKLTYLTVYNVAYATL